MSNKLKRVKELVFLGFKVNYKMPAFQKRTALHVAAESGFINIVSFLIDNNAIVNVKDKSGVPPIFIACSKGHSQVVKLLLRSGAKIKLKTDIG